MSATSMRYIRDSEIHRPRLMLKNHCGEEVVVTSARFNFQGKDVHWKRQGMPFWSLEHVEVAGIDETIGHCHVKIDDPPIISKNEEIKFRAVVMKYPKGNAWDWSLDGNTMRDLQVLRRGRWVVPDWPDEPEESVPVFPPIRPVVPQVKQTLDFKATMALRRQAEQAGGIDALENAKQLADLSVQAGGWEALADILLA